MNLPDLSFLSRNEAPRDPAPARRDAAAAPAGAAHGPDENHGGGEGRRAKGPQAELIEQLRAAQRELQIQNQELLYSQQAAESASERFEALFASVPLSLMVLDEHDMVVQANAMAHRSFQPTEFDRPLTSLMPFVSDSDADRVHRAFASARVHGRSDTSEVVFQIGSNRRMTSDLHIAYIETQQGSGTPLRQFLCAVIDQGPLLAERQTLQQRNEQLHAGERRLEAVINSALDAIVCVDQHQRITVFNPTAAALFQCPTRDALGSPLSRFFPDLERAPAYAQLTTQVAMGEMHARTATGRLLAVEVNMAFEHHEGNLTTTVFARDLTARKRAEKRRQELEVQLRESQKMQAVGTMAGGIAHDFNNILHAILGNVELAKADAATPDTDARVLESLREIDKAARRARDLVRQILAFSRDEARQRHAVQLTDLMRETERLVRVTLPKNILFEVHTPARLPLILADATQVEQALLNLCTNAVQALGTRLGQVRMRAQVLRLEPQLRERLHLSEATCVALDVADDGPGMDAQTRARIFEPFFTTKPVGQGTGLGLPVVHGVMRTHGGAIDVRSAPGKGCCFTLYFPLADVDAEPQDLSRPAPLLSAAEMAAPADARKPCVMYVDDDEALVFLVQRLLGRRSCEVCGFTDPQAALAALARQPDRYDLVITDYNMPSFSGVQLLRAARAIRADLPVALASGYITAEIEQAALDEGARALIHKPNDVQELCRTVDRLLHGGD
ncbi:MAG: hybrid sensor histidine kinase/response regulator [Comamonas sp. SCN 67-35]|uniref:PAS domain-containing hybrid sensor histidine kinase/response regulator n=1 Tax=unclassified Comamonas TaxID=2638500 RepID=UPI00086F5B0A|nr:MULTISPECIES: PAS domain-containing sensor histidine kinase [unclassified Comamonas]MBN9330470.1 response regulator [Comamonas sp.]ODU39110.1 MAG: hybrid sensor histidine kinase/response regulator [Comamonas sp. SCN 67-35]OJW98343.1 MAG: hybrid sensor histidine kinase/response regulator [Burkholderiales bacterium 66-26]